MNRIELGRIIWKYMMSTPLFTFDDLCIFAHKEADVHSSDAVAEIVDPIFEQGLIERVDDEGHYRVVVGTM